MASRNARDPEGRGEFSHHDEKSCHSHFTYGWTWEPSFGMNKRKANSNNVDRRGNSVEQSCDSRRCRGMAIFRGHESSPRLRLCLRLHVALSGPGLPAAFSTGRRQGRLLSLRRHDGGARTGSQSSDTGRGALSLVQLCPTNPGPVTCFRGVRFYSWPTGPAHPAWAKQLGQRWTGGPRGLLSQKQRLCFGGGAGPRHCVSPEERAPPPASLLSSP